MGGEEIDRKVSILGGCLGRGMVTEGSIGMLSNAGMRPLMAGGEELERDLGAMLRDQRRQEVGDRERELNLFRSPSAPPTVEGSLSAVGGLFGSIGDPKFAGKNAFSTEEELRSDPEYLSYYYSNVNLNPRLPPPVLSKEDWRFTQRLKAGGSGLGGIGDRRRVETVGGGSLFSSQPPGLNTQREEEGGKSQVREWLDKGDDGLIGLPGLGLTGRQKSFAEIVQVD